MADSLVLHHLQPQPGEVPVTPRLALMACLTAFVTVPVRAADSPLIVDLGGGVTMELILVKKGTFQQGSPADEPNRGADETQRQVTLSQDYYLGKYPVTVGQFKRFVQETNYRTEAEKGTSGGFGFDGKELVQRKEFNWKNPGFKQTDDHPVTIISYQDAKAFLEWLSKKAGRRCDLPTEAQWEHACRGGTTTAYYNGADAKAADDIAWHKGNSGDGTRPVGQKKANPLGLYDMAGNVHEWCRDWHAPYKAGPVTDPEATQPVEQNRRVLRGGSWNRDPKNGRSAARWRNDPGSRNADNGFRVMAAAQAAPQPTPPSTQPTPTRPTVPPQPQPTPPAPLPTPSPGAPGSFVPWYCCCCGFGGLGLVALVVVLVMRLGKDGRRTRTPPAPPVSSPPAPPPSRPSSRTDDYRIRIGADGFWVEAPGTPRGTELRYSCRLGNGSGSGSFAYEPGPGGQFVYTGERPSEVVVTRGDGMLGGPPVLDDPSLPSRMSSSAPPIPPTRKPSTPFRGHPPAY